MYDKNKPFNSIKPGDTFTYGNSSIKPTYRVTNFVDADHFIAYNLADPLQVSNWAWEKDYPFNWIYRKKSTIVIFVK